MKRSESKERFVRYFVRKRHKLWNVNISRYFKHTPLSFLLSFFFKYIATRNRDVDSVNKRSSRWRRELFRLLKLCSRLTCVLSSKTVMTRAAVYYLKRAKHYVTPCKIGILSSTATFFRLFSPGQSPTKFSQKWVIFLSGRRRLWSWRLGRRRRFLRGRSHR